MISKNLLRNLLYKGTCPRRHTFGKLGGSLVIFVKIGGCLTFQVIDGVIW